MAVRRKGGRWVVEFMQSGHRVFKRLPAEATRVDAVAYETKLRREIFDQATLGKRPEITLSYAIQSWLDEVNEGRKSASATKNHADNITRDLGGDPVSEIGRVAEEVRKRLAFQGREAATINRRLCILKAVAKFAWRKGWLAENLSAHIQLLPENNARHIYLTREQVDSLIAAAPTEDGKAFIAWGVYTGMRQGEIMRLKAAGASVDIMERKAGGPGRLPVIAWLKPYLSAIPFTKHARTLYKDFETAREAIGMPNLHYHDLRHTTASLMIQAGVELYTVGQILGHKSVQTTRRYAHLTEGNKREALEKAFRHPIKITAAPYQVNEDK